MEHRALDRGACEHVALVLGQPVDALLQQRAKRGWKRRAARERLLDRERHDLLGEQRVALGLLDHPPRRARRRRLVGEQAGDQLLGVCRGERLEHGDLSGALGPRPRWALLEQLRPRRRDDHDRPVGEAGEVLDQVEQPRLGPVEVVERDHERRVVRHALEQSPERPLDLLARAAATAGADRDGDAVRDLLAAVHIGEPLRQAGRDVVPHQGAHDRVEREHARALAVGETAPDRHDRSLRQRRRELAHEPRLPDAWRPEQGDDPGASLGGRPLERVCEQRALHIAVDERRAAGRPRQRMVQRAAA